MVHGSFKSIFRLAKCSQIYWHLTIQCGWTPKPPRVAYLSVLKLWTHDLYFSSTSISPHPRSESMPCASWTLDGIGLTKRGKYLYHPKSRNGKRYGWVDTHIKGPFIVVGKVHLRNELRWCIPVICASHGAVLTLPFLSHMYPTCQWTCWLTKAVKSDNQTLRVYGHTEK